MVKISIRLSEWFAWYSELKKGASVRARKSCDSQWGFGGGIELETQYTGYILREEFFYDFNRFIVCQINLHYPRRCKSVSGTFFSFVLHYCLQNASITKMNAHWISWLSKRCSLSSTINWLSSKIFTIFVKTLVILTQLSTNTKFPAFSLFFSWSVWVSWIRSWCPFCVACIIFAVHPWLPFYQNDRKCFQLTGNLKPISNT